MGARACNHAVYFAEADRTPALASRSTSRSLRRRCRSRPGPLSGTVEYPDQRHARRKSLPIALCAAVEPFGPRGALCAAGPAAILVVPAFRTPCRLCDPAGASRGYRTGGVGIHLAQRGTVTVPASSGRRAL